MPICLSSPARHPLQHALQQAQLLAHAFDAPLPAPHALAHQAAHEARADAGAEDAPAPISALPFPNPFPPISSNPNTTTATPPPPPHTILLRQPQRSLDVAQDMHRDVQQQADLQGAKGVERDAADREAGEDGRDGGLRGARGTGLGVGQHAAVHKAVQAHDTDVAREELQDGGHVGGVVRGGRGWGRVGGLVVGRGGGGGGYGRRDDATAAGGGVGGVGGRGRVGAGEGGEQGEEGGGALQHAADELGLERGCRSGGRGGSLLEVVRCDLRVELHRELGELLHALALAFLDGEAVIVGGAAG